MESIFNFTKEELESIIVKLGCKKFLVSQIFDWIYQKKIYDPLMFTNIKKENQELLKNSFDFSMLKIEKVEEDVDTKKFLFRLHDDQKVEAALMEHPYGISLCISSQVGCNMGCKFCESGRLKKVRDLKVYEMILQVIMVSEYIKKRIDSIVIMGIGEPFDNFDNICNFIKLINDPKSLGIGARHITVSTCGIVPKIYEFADLNIQANLAISLHAPNDEIRNKIMPISNAYNIDQLIQAIKDYIDKTHRRVTIEYVMLDNINDKKEDALELVELLKQMNVYVNLIPYNETSNISFKASSKKRIDEFYQVLKENNIDVTVRRSYGKNISAACGQLRSKDI